MDRIRVVVSDDQGMLGECLIDRLGKAPDLEIVAEVADPSAAVVVARDLSPDIVLMDIDVPGSPFLAGSEITRCCPSTRVIYLSAYSTDQLVAQSIEAGARGYVLKSHTAERVIAAIRDVAAGRDHFAAEVLARLTVGGKGVTPQEKPRTRFTQLTPREVEVLGLLAKGLSVKQVAKRLGVSYKTVDNQTCSLMKKLDIHSRAELVRYAIREKLAVV